MADIHDANARDLMRDMPDAGPSEDDIAEALRSAARRAQLCEREACAKLAESVHGDFERDTPGRTESAVRNGIAAAIRARNK